MKKLKFLLQLLLVAIILVSCEKDDLKDNPVLQEQALEKEFTGPTIDFEALDSLEAIQPRPKNYTANHRWMSSGIKFNRPSIYGNLHIVGSYNADLKRLLQDWRYPVAYNLNLNFWLPRGQRYNLLNESQALYNKFRPYFPKVNAFWIKKGVERKKWLPFGNLDGKTLWRKTSTVLVASHTKYLRNRGKLTGFGKEIWMLEHIYNMKPVHINGRVQFMIANPFPKDARYTRQFNQTPTLTKIWEYQKATGGYKFEFINPWNGKVTKPWQLVIKGYY